MIHVKNSLIAGVFLKVPILKPYSWIHEGGMRNNDS